MKPAWTMRTSTAAVKRFNDSTLLTLLTSLTILLTRFAAGAAEKPSGIPAGYKLQYEQSCDSPDSLKQIVFSDPKAVPDARITPVARYRLAESPPGDYLLIGPVPSNLLPDRGSTAAVYRLGQREPVLKLPGLDAGLGGNPNRDLWAYDKHLHLIPEARVLVALPFSRDRVVLHRAQLPK